MVSKRNDKFDVENPAEVENGCNWTLNLFDPKNPDINLFNEIDDEIIKLGGSQLLIYKYVQDRNYDDLYDEDRRKVISPEPTLVHGHYTPRPIDENLTEFGIQIENDQIFTFNKYYINKILRRDVIPGDQIKPKFQNIKYEVHQVIEDSFKVYGVYHLICYAKVMRDNDETRRDKLDSDL